MTTAPEISLSPYKASPDADPLTAFAARHGHEDPADAMRELCDRLRRVTGQVEPPIGVESDMLSVLRAYQRKGGRGDVDARLDVVGGQYRVRVPNQFWRRRRFTVAHEIAHMLVLDSLADRPALVAALRSERNMPRLEELCNQAAGELLMPSAAIAGDLRRIRFSRRDLDVMHDRYLVSWGALLTRITEVIPEAGLTVWDFSSRNEDEATLRVARSYGRSPYWLPVGLSQRYLSEGLASLALLRGEGSSGALRVSFGGRARTALAVAAPLPASAPGVVALLLLGESEHELWCSLVESSEQLALPLIA